MPAAHGTVGTPDISATPDIATTPDIVFVGDDFTGACDTLATLARAGRRTRLFLDVPDLHTVAPALDAVGVATGLRALAAHDISAALQEMAPKLARLKARFVHYKVCSTFDSGPQVGSIGAAVLALRKHLAPVLVAIIGGQPSLGRYCHFGNLFAAAADGEVYRIDRHPVMRDHPVTPMREADLRVHLGAQQLTPIRLLDRAARAEGAASLARAIHGAIATGSRELLFDVGATDDLLVIGEALRQIEVSGPILLVGASSVAESLTLSDPAPALRNQSPGATVKPREVSARKAPVLVFAGSRSSVTEAQIASSRRFHRIAIEPADLALPAAVGRIAGACTAALRDGSNVLAYLLPGRGHGMSGLRLAHASAELVATIVDAEPIGSLGVAGGDTSSVIVRRLGFTSLSYDHDLDRGVPVCVGQAAGSCLDGVSLMLKGGQMGAPDILDRFVNRI